MSADISILIAQDAAAASRALLGRDDLRVRWALTEAEVTAVIAQTRCTVCVARGPIARSVLAAAARAGRAIDTLVLLDGEDWGAWRDYFDAGARVVLQSSATDDLLTALGEVTGVAFRAERRFPFRTAVGFALGAEGGSWTSINLSAGGLCLEGFPPYALGAEVELAFELDGKRYEFGATVQQVLRVNGQRAVGLSFAEVSNELRTQLEQTVAGLARRARPLTEPDEFDDLDESTLHQLRTSNVGGDRLALMQELVSRGRVAQSQRAEPWLRAACDAMSTQEIRAIREPAGAPAWVRDALVARLRVYQVRFAERGEAPAEPTIVEVLGLCKQLALSGAGAPADELVHITNVRAEILRTLYAPDLLAAM